MRRRHPEFRPTGDEKSDAIQLLAIEAMKRSQARARTQMVYRFERKPGGNCSRCRMLVSARYDGTPPLDDRSLPNLVEVCIRCAGGLEGAARDRRSADANG